MNYLIIYIVMAISTIIFQRLSNKYWINKTKNTKILEMKLMDRDDIFINGLFWPIFLSFNLIFLMIGEEKSTIVQKYKNIEDLEQEKMEITDDLFKNESKMDDKKYIEIANKLEVIDLKLLELNE